MILYKVLTSETKEGIEGLVNHHLAGGWSLSSGICITTPSAIAIGANRGLTEAVTLTLSDLNFVLLYGQAMIKEVI